MNVINEWIAARNENEKKLLVVTIVIVVAALLYLLFIGPTMSRLSSIEEDIKNEEIAIKQDMHFLGYKNRILKESEEIAPYLTKNKLSDDEMIAAFLNKIQSLATESKVNLIKINPNPGEQDAEYWKYQADLECSGQLADVISFMHAINSDTDLMKVDKFNFSGKKSDTDEIKAAMTVEKIVVTALPMPAKAKDANASSATPSS